MTITLHWNWTTFVVVYLCLSAAIVFIRGVVGSVREYTLWDAISGVAEIAFPIWVVVTKL